MIRVLLSLLFGLALISQVGASEIHRAVAANDTNLVSSIIQTNPDAVNATDSLNRTPLHVAARQPDPAMLAFLLSHGANANAADNNQVTALHSAAARGFTAHIELLTESGVNLNAKHVRGDTPLHAAVMSGQAPAAQSLITLGADVNVVNAMQRTPLMGACQLGMADVVSKLIDAGAVVGTEDADGNAALVYAAGSGQVEIVTLLLEHNADATARDWMGDGPIFAASFSGNSEIAALLVAAGADPAATNQRLITPLHNAAGQGHDGFVRFLLDAEVPLDVQDSLGRTPLYMAAAGGHCRMVNTLLENGANRALTDTEGLSPREIAEANGWQLVAELLQDGNDAAGCSALEELHSSRLQWTGVAVSADGRVFANYPRWSPYITHSVVELLPSGEERPFPDQDMNGWRDGMPAENRFVCVQSVFCDNLDHLWILDTGNPYFSGVRPQGAKLMQVDLTTNQIVRTFVFDSLAAPSASYLNDVRVDREAGFAYMTESGMGAIVVLNLETGKARRLLDDHPSTSAENTEVNVGGVPLLGADGKPMMVHSDGIALSPDKVWLYYQALTGRTLYRVPTAALRDPGLSEDQLAAKIERVTESGISDGIMFDRDGRLYLSSVELSAIRRVNTDGSIEIVAQDPDICWPDSFARMPDGSICFTTSRIHEMGRFQDEFKIFRLPLADGD